jgi:Arc/MetJ family transcription regulator
LSDVVEQFEHEARGRRRGGLDAVRGELDELIAETVETVRVRSRAFWETYESERDPALLAAWFVPRCWREIDYVFMLGEVIRRYGLTFERRHVTALSRQLLDEAEHYDAVARIVERLGGRVPVQAPPSAVEWSGFLRDSLARHRLGAIAAWNMSETAATGTLRGHRRGRPPLRPPRRRARLRADHQGREVPRRPRPAPARPLRPERGGCRRGHARDARHGGDHDRVARRDRPGLSRR